MKGIRKQNHLRAVYMKEDVQWTCKTWRDRARVAAEISEHDAEHGIRCPQAMQGRDNDNGSGLESPGKTSQESVGRNRAGRKDEHEGQYA